MEFNEKVQELRKQKGLTQEELAQLLYVSRAAVSKWESGRGYPNIDSLKAIAKFFCVTVDDLLSGDQILTIAEEDKRRQEDRLRNLVFGVLDLSVVLFLFLPLFGQKTDAGIRAVSLLALDGVPGYLMAAYGIIVAAMALVGILTVTPLKGLGAFLQKRRHNLSLGLSIVSVLLLIATRQTYAASLLFIFLVIKVLMLIKRQ